jgi:hypothetical protein
MQNGSDETGLTSGSSMEQQAHQEEAAYRFKELHKTSTRIDLLARVHDDRNFGESG